jgi:hypothetical protein
MPLAMASATKLGTGLGSLRSCGAPTEYRRENEAAIWCASYSLDAFGDVWDLIDEVFQ